MAANDGEHPVTSLFGWALPGGTNAPGSQGATEADAMSDNAFRVPVTSPYMSVQNTEPPRVGVGLDDSALPGQTTEGLSGQNITSTGAGLGSDITSGHHPNAGGRA